MRNAYRRQARRGNAIAEFPATITRGAGTDHRQAMHAWPRLAWRTGETLAIGVCCSR